MEANTVTGFYHIAKRDAIRSMGGDQAYRIAGPTTRRAFVAESILYMAYSSVKENKNPVYLEALYDRMTSDPELSREV